jgi:hypothetical protein
VDDFFSFFLEDDVHEFQIFGQTGNTGKLFAGQNRNRKDGNIPKTMRIKLQVYFQLNKGL